MSKQKYNYDNLIFDDEEQEPQNISQPKENTKFLNRLHNKKNKQFENTWLNTVTEEHRIQLKDQIKQTVGNSKYKFKYLFQIPYIINNPKLQNRKKTYEIFTKNSQLDQYYMQLKKTSSKSIDTIQSKAEYKDILSQISNNKVHDTYQHQHNKNNSVIFTNELWSQKLRNQISQQSRLKELSELLEQNKIKMSYDEQLLNFQDYFTKKQGQKKESVSDMRDIIKTAFLTDNLKDIKISNQNQPKESQNINLQSYFRRHLDEQTLDNSTKNSRKASNNHIHLFRPQSQDYSIISRHASTFQKNQSDIMYTQFNQLESPLEKLKLIIEDSCKENQSTKSTISKVNNFLKLEKEVQERTKTNKIQFYQTKTLNNAIKIKKQRETNSHISSSII